MARKNKAGLCSQLILFCEIAADAQKICEKPAYRYGPPYARYSEERQGGECISQRHPGAQGYDCKHNRHSGFSERAVQAVEKEENADQCIECPFDPQIADPFRNYGSFSGIYEQRHQRFCKNENSQRDDQTETDRSQDGRADSFSDPVCFACAEILGNKDREGIAEILDRQIGKGVDLYRCGKRGHDCCAETVDQALNRNPDSGDIL